MFSVQYKLLEIVMIVHPCDNITGNAVPATAISSFVLLCSIFDRPGLAPNNSKYINAAISRLGW